VARGRRLDLHVRLVRLYLEEDLALCDSIAFLLVPRDHAAFVHREAELREDHLRHAHATSSLATRTMSSTCGTTVFSRCCAYGIGVSRPARRRGGASRSSKASSATIAAISPPYPPRLMASCTTSSRCVLRTEPRTVSRSSGTRLRRSMTSASMPSLAS